MEFREQPMMIMDKIWPTVIAAGLTVCLCFVPPSECACAFDFEDAAEIGTGYTTYLFLHEMVHQVVAEEVGADSPKIGFFTRNGSNCYPWLSTHEGIPIESKLPYAVGGEQMAGVTFEFALPAYRRKPTTYNKALLFFSYADFVVCTLLANYVKSESDMYDPNPIREEVGCSNEVLLSLVLAKSLLNTYRGMNQDAKCVSMIWVDKERVALLLNIPF